MTGKSAYGEFEKYQVQLYEVCKKKNFYKQLLKEGFVPFPLRCLTKYNASQDRYKYVPPPSWQETNQNTATADFREVKQFGGFGIVCGERSGVTIVDVDVKNNGMNLFNKLVNDLNLSLENVPAEKTPSGGLHLFYKYTDRIKKSKIIGIDGYLDILNDDKENETRACCYTSPTNGYERLNEFPESTAFYPEMPEQLLNYILENMPKEKAKSQLSDKQTIYEGDFSYILSYPLIKNIYFFLNEFPAQYHDERKIWWQVLMFFKHIYLHSSELYQPKIYEQYLKFCKKSKHYKTEAWSKKEFEKQKDTEDSQIGWFINRIKEFGLDEKHKKQFRLLHFDKHLHANANNCEEYKFIEMREDDNDYCSKTLEDMYKYDTVFIKAPTNSGKTTMMSKTYAEYFKSKRLLCLSVRRSQTSTYRKAFADNNIPVANYEKYKDDKVLNNLKHLSIQIDSLSRLTPEIWQDCVLVLDEFTAIFNRLVVNKTPDFCKKRKLLHAQLNELIRNASKVIVLDGDLHKPSIEQVMYLRNKDTAMMYINRNKKYRKNKAYIFEREKDVFNKMIDDLRKGNKICFCANGKNKLKALAEEIYKILPEQKGKIKLYTAEEGDRDELDDVNESWDDYSIGYNTAITVGVDFHSTEKRNVYAFIYPFETATYQDVLQMIARTRNMKDVFIFVKDMHHLAQYRTVQEAEDYFNKQIDFNKGILKITNEDSPNEAFIKRYAMPDDDGYYKLFKCMFVKYWLYVKTDEEISKGHLSYFICDKLVERGFNVEFVEPDENEKEDNAISKETTKELKVDKVQKIDRIIQKIINSEFSDEDTDENIKSNILFKMKFVGLCDFNDRIKEPKLSDIEITDEQIEVLKDVQIIIANDSEFKNYRMFWHMKKTLNDLIEFTINARNKINDYDVMDCKDDKVKYTTIKKLEEIMKIESYDIETDNLKERFNEKITVDDELLRGITRTFNIRRKGGLKIETFKDAHDLLISLYKMAGCTMILSTEKQIRKGKERGKLEHIYSISSPTYKTNELLFKHQQGERKPKRKTDKEITNEIIASWHSEKIQMGIEPDSDDEE
jgi:hypothetical protein